MEINSIKQRFGIIGRSEALDRAINIAARVASTDLTVLIRGESGVGKEIFSRIIHELSKRKHNKFIAINTGALPEGTINSELFGHEKGAFTGATSERKGYFETVNGGTISHGLVRASHSQTGYYTSASTTVGADGLFHFPAQPNPYIRLNGTVTLVDGRRIILTDKLFSL